MQLDCWVCWFCIATQFTNTITWWMLIHHLFLKKIIIQGALLAREHFTIHILPSLSSLCRWEHAASLFTCDWNEILICFVWLSPAKNWNKSKQTCSRMIVTCKEDNNLYQKNIFFCRGRIFLLLNLWVGLFRHDGNIEQLFCRVLSCDGLKNARNDREAWSPWDSLVGCLWVCG